MNHRQQQHQAGIVQQRLRRQVSRAIADYAMIADGDRVMVCLSGGKDSHAMLDILLALQTRAPIHFDLLAVVLDQGHPGFDATTLAAHCAQLGVTLRLVEQDTYTIVKRVIPAGATMCGLCSRLRRGVLYRIAGEEQADKIALGHHADDIVETFFMNMFFGSKLKAMPPKLFSDDGQHTVIRPLAYCREKDLARYAARRQFPIIPCNLCGADGGGARAQMKKMLRDWETQHPGRIQNIFRALQNVAPSHLLDGQLFNFGGDGSPLPKPFTTSLGETIHVVP